MEGLGAEMKPEMVGLRQKGVLDMSHCNLAHRLIAKNFNASQTLEYLLDEFTVQNSYN